MKGVFYKNVEKSLGHNTSLGRWFPKDFFKSVRRTPPWYMYVVATYLCVCTTIELQAKQIWNLRVLGIDFIAIDY